MCRSTSRLRADRRPGSSAGPPETKTDQFRPSKFARAGQKGQIRPAGLPRESHSSSPISWRPKASAPSRYWERAQKADDSQLLISRVKIGAAKTVPGTVNAAIVGFYQSQAFLALRPITKAGYRNRLEASNAA
jgi:hypothetical protein